MAAYMELNGAACVFPSQLLRESQLLPYLDFNLSEWVGKANAFHCQRGSDPSYGYLLVTDASLQGSASELKIVFQDGTEKVFKVQIESAKKIIPANSKEQGYYLAKVVDERYALSQTLVGKRFNLLEEYVPPSSSTSQGTFKYVKETIREVSSTLSVPHDWPSLFKEVFKVPSEQELQTNGITFPTYTPQDLDWRYVTRRDALEMLLQWTGTSIVYQEGEQNWKLVTLEDQGNSKLTTLLEYYDSLALSKNRFSQFKEAGSPHPKKFKLYFRRFTPSNGDVDQYKIEERTPSKAPKNGNEISVRLPSYYVGESPSIPQPSNEVATDWFGRAEKQLSFFPSQEKTYRGFLYNPPNMTGVEGSNAYPMIPSAFVEKVSWFDIGDGPKTLLLSVSPRKWIGPQELLYPAKDKTRIAVGKVVGNVSAGQPTFTVNDLRMVVGNPPSDDPSAAVFTNNTHKQDYSSGNTIMIFSEEGSEIWDTDRSGGGAGVVRFELKEDLALTDNARKAYLLDELGQKIPNPNYDSSDSNSEEFVVVFVSNARNMFYGYKEYDDPQYGFQAGYKGTAFLLLPEGEGLGDLAYYEIINMEAEARWISGTFNQEMSPDATSVKCKVDSYWGNAPNGRPPKTEEIEEGTSQDDPINGVRVWDEQDLVTMTLPEGTKYRAVLDEKKKKYILASVQLLKASILRRFKATSSIGAASGMNAGQEGSGTAQIYKDDRTPDGSPKTITNGFLDSFEDKSVGYVDISKNPPEIISVGCTTAT